MKTNFSTTLFRLLPGREPKAEPAAAAAMPWARWVRAALQLPLHKRQKDAAERIELLDRLSLGGRKALLLVAVSGRQMLVGVGEDGPRSITSLNECGAGRSKRSNTALLQRRSSR